MIPSKPSLHDASTILLCSLRWNIFSLARFDRSKSAKKTAVKRLLHDRKRAMKGAKRELRRDNHFISTVQLNEQVKKDAVRNRKVKEIFSNLYSQESEHKAMQRQKAKMKI